MAVFIHDSAIVDEGARIGDGSRIWHWVHVCKGAQLGRDVSLGQNVFVASDVVIGDNAKIQNNVSIYEGVTLKEDVFCGPSVVFTNVYNPRSHVSRKSEYKKTLVEKGATLGANSTVVCGVKIGAYAFVGAGTVINKDIKPFALMVGVPARQIGWMSRFGERINLPISGDGKEICPHTNDVYCLKNGNMECEDK